MATQYDDLRLIRTKLNQPRVNDELVKRPRLIELLNRQLEYPLALVVAPAGYGKTTLVASWLDVHRYKRCWLSLDEYDNDLSVFLGYLTAAIRREFPDSCRETSALLDGIGLPPIPIIASSLINDLDALPEPLVIVLDDYHTIREPTIHELLDMLLRYPPDPMRLVLIARRDPLLPLSWLRAQGRLVEIRTQHLRFTQTEIADLVKQSLPAEVGGSAILTLEEQTEGWITGLRLALLALQHQGDSDVKVNLLQRDGRYIADYLLSEVFAQQSAQIQTFLVQTSVFGRLSASLCEAVLEDDVLGEDMQSFLTSSRATNLFVVALDAEGKWFRYHHLLQRFLQGQARTRLTVDEIVVLHRRAAEWFSAEGLIEEALRHYLAAGDYESAKQLLVVSRHALMARGYWSGIHRYLGMLPDGAVAQEPELLIQQVWIDRIQWRSASVRADLEHVERLLADSNVRHSPMYAIQGEVDALKATLALQEGAAQEAVGLLEGAIKSIDPEHSYVRGYSTMLLANAYQISGGAEASIALLSEALRDAADDNQLQMRLWSALGLIRYLEADLDGAWLAGTRYNQVSKGRAEADGMKWGEYRLGSVAYLRNDLTSAAQSFAACSDRPRAVHTMTTTNTAIGLALTYQAQGRTDQAREIAERNVAVLEALGHIALLPLAEAFRAELAARQGRLEDALKLVPQAGTVPMVSEYIGFYAPQLALPKLLLLEDTPRSRARARTVLLELNEILGRRHNQRFLIDVLALQALAHKAEGNSTRARADLSQAICLAEPGGFLRPFLDLGPGLLDLLKELAVSDGPNAYASQVIDAFGSARLPEEKSQLGAEPNESTQRKHLDLIESLTNREMDVLLLLADRLTNKEIARELGISSATVKQHEINLYRKLHVNNRRQAATAARTLGIV